MYQPKAIKELRDLPNTRLSQGIAPCPKTLLTLYYNMLVEQKQIVHDRATCCKMSFVCNAGFSFTFNMSENMVECFAVNIFRSYLNDFHLYVSVPN